MENKQKTEGQGRNQREKKSEEEGEIGVQRQLQRKAALECGSVWSEGGAWSSQGQSASHHWWGAIYSKEAKQRFP
jgi:hypothetical protein